MTAPFYNYSAEAALLTTFSAISVRALSVYRLILSYLGAKNFTFLTKSSISKGFSR